MNLQVFKKKLRSNQTDSENLLWQHLRAKRFYGWKFKRQEILRGYIVDFICFKKKLIIELDGGQHVDQQEYDLKRTEVLEKDGFRVLRFWNNDVMENIEGVLESIYNTPLPPLRVDLSHKGRGKSEWTFIMIYLPQGKGA